MQSKGTVLTVDDDQNLQVVVGQYLEGDGYNVVTAQSVAMALEKADSMPLDVILLDLVLPDGEGLSLIPQFKTKTKAPIIVVSGKSDTTEKIICLEMGADDYLTKPFEMRELSARIKVALRRVEAVNVSASPSTANDEPDILHFNDGWRLERGQYQLYNKDNVSANLTTGEFKMLEALILAPNRALSREHLFDLTRDGEFDAYDRAIDIQIGRIRKKLNDNDNVIIKTVRGVGYMFAGQVQS